MPQIIRSMSYWLVCQIWLSISYSGVATQRRTAGRGRWGEPPEWHFEVHPVGRHLWILEIQVVMLIPWHLSSVIQRRHEMNETRDKKQERKKKDTGTVRYLRRYMGETTFEVYNNYGQHWQNEFILWIAILFFVFSSLLKPNWQNKYRITKMKNN